VLLDKLLDLLSISLGEVILEFLESILVISFHNFDIILDPFLFEVQIVEVIFVFGMLFTKLLKFFLLDLRH
jgi:hypothetical protein